MQVEQKNSDEVEKGIVISQKEEPDTVIPRFSKVTVVISAGSDKVDLSELGLSGMTLERGPPVGGKNLKDRCSGGSQRGGGFRNDHPL